MSDGSWGRGLEDGGICETEGCCSRVVAIMWVMAVLSVVLINRVGGGPGTVRISGTQEM